MNRLLLLLFSLLIIGQTQAQSLYADEIVTYREQRKLNLSKPSYSPFKTEEAFAKLQYFAPDSSFRVTATVQLTPEAAPIELGYAVNGIPKSKVKPYAVLSFIIEGVPCQLTAYQDIPKEGQKPEDELTLLFKDATSGKVTYGGGRSLNLTTNDLIRGHITLDFNKAHNSWCAYDPTFFCPVPPKTNWLAVAIKAGEKTYGGDH